ncbi:MAG TPA: hypothetical protein VJ987_14505 [Anaerolineales bacterium]|nr:hypothetical protein [Anaerolineales bacterium]
MTRIILLDIDSVLVEPLGYRAALRATVQHFIGSDIYIDEDLLTSLETRGISSEWDMVPLIIASCWNSILVQQPMQNLPDDVSAAAHEIQRQRRVEGSIKVPAFDNVSGKYPTQTAYEAGLFSSLPKTLRKNLLTETRDVHKSHSMRTLQHFTLGSRHFSETYNMPAEIETESFLLKYDRSNVDDKIRARLLQGDNLLAAFTARPSHPPREIKDQLFGYAPEAELALELVGMKDIPLIAFGKLEYIAAQHGIDPATLVKPSPFQALAATLAAWTGDELSALEAAYEWHSIGKLNEIFNDLPKSFELIVVEDTMGGIRSVSKAGEILRNAGFDVTIRAFGLTSGSKAKAGAFEQAGIVHFENWDELIPALIR